MFSFHLLQNATILIKDTLENLYAKDLKSFNLELLKYNKSEYKPIPKGRLEHQDIIDIALMMTQYYRCDEALRVTIDILNNIDQRELASQLQRNMGKKTLSLHTHCIFTCFLNVRNAVKRLERFRLKQTDSCLLKLQF